MLWHSQSMHVLSLSIKLKGNRSGKLTFRGRLPHDAPVQTHTNTPKPLQLQHFYWGWSTALPVPAQWLAIYCNLLLQDFRGWTSRCSKASDLLDRFTPPYILFIHPVCWPPLAGSHQVWAKSTWTVTIAQLMNCNLTTHQSPTQARTAYCIATHVLQHTLSAL